jgi:N-acetylglucosamine repressor
MEHLLTKATRQHTKDHNTRLVLRTIYEGETISRAELARRTGLTRTTVSSVVGELLERHVVEEIGTGHFSGGRLPILLRVADGANHVLAVTLVDTQIAGALVSMRGLIQQQISLPLREVGPEAVVARLTQVVDLLIDQAGGSVLGIGVSLPGVIDTLDGVVRSAVNYGLVDLPLRQLLQAHYDLPVYLGSMVHLAALAEYTFGKGAASGNLIAVSMGVGIGAGIVLQGRLFSGDSFGAGEIGHVVVVPDGPICNCGHRGCLETVASTSAIVRAARELVQHNSTILAGMDPNEVDFASVRRALEAGDPAVQQLVSRVGNYLALALANAIGLLNIERIVLSGPVATLGQPLLDAVNAGIRGMVLASLAETTRVELLADGGDAVLRGAAAMVLDAELGLVRVSARG